MNCSRPHRQRHIIDGDKAAELTGQVHGLQDRVTHPRSLLFDVAAVGPADCISLPGAQDWPPLMREALSMRLRSPLFAPGDSERKMVKAIASAADAVILDLEDSVAASAKPTARAM